MTRVHTTIRRQRARAVALQQELQALEQDLASSSSKENNALKALAKAECYSLCNRVTTQLPREVRDMIYHHLSTSPKEHITREYFRSTMDPETKLHTYDTARWKAINHPEHFWDVKYVGQNFFRELVENYYYTSTFSFGDEDGLIERFLNADQIGLGYAPKEMVSKIEIHLSATTFDRKSCVGYMFGCPTKPEQLRSAMEGVESLRFGAEVCVDFATRAKNETEKEEQIEMACRELIPILQRAKLAGLGVRFVIDTRVEMSLNDVSGMRQLEQV
jgi:hypothetical protein